MKALKRLSSKAAEFCEMSGLDVNLVRYHMKTSQFDVLKCERKREMDEHGVDYAHPYVIFNPLDMSLEKRYN